MWGGENLKGNENDIKSLRNTPILVRRGLYLDLSVCFLTCYNVFGFAVVFSELFSFFRFAFVICYFVFRIVICFALLSRRRNSFKFLTQNHTLR